MKLKTFALSALAALGIASGAAYAAGEEGHVTNFDFPFQGVFGSYDRNQLQRGLQVYTEVCAACHGLEYVPFRTLSDPNGPELPPEQMRAYAANFQIQDPVTGEFRAAEQTDSFPPSSLDNAPDLSLMTKARAGFHGPYGLGINQLIYGIGGPEYVASILLGYTGEEEIQAGTPFYENVAFGGLMAMPDMLFDGGVQYADGTEATREQMAVDVAAFLTWTAEPKMMERKQAGLTGFIFLVVLSVLLYLTNKKLWAPVKRRAKDS